MAVIGRIITSTEQSYLHPNPWNLWICYLTLQKKIWRCVKGKNVYMGEVAQMVKNLPATWKTWVQSLGQEDPLEREMATHTSILPGEFHGQRSLAGYSPWCCRLGHDWVTNNNIWTVWFNLITGNPKIRESFPGGSEKDMIMEGELERWQHEKGSAPWIYGCFWDKRGHMPGLERDFHKLGISLSFQSMRKWGPQLDTTRNWILSTILMSRK